MLIEVGIAHIERKGITDSQAPLPRQSPQRSVLGGDRVVVDETHELLGLNDLGGQVGTMPSARPLGTGGVGRSPVIAHGTRRRITVDLGEDPPDARRIEAPALGALSGSGEIQASDFCTPRAEVKPGGSLIALRTSSSQSGRIQAVTVRNMASRRRTLGSWR
ncbi:hypothetical protein [Streptomyces sp. 891-h]|uniref:hypothetical protein n=1 Tax=Streptomyces sp. 891-h TaxID=2720714 RepID=UPI001FAA3922|nr:hypothetical protein [Streptomyces sp. 891-h]